MNMKRSGRIVDVKIKRKKKTLFRIVINYSLQVLCFVKLNYDRNPSVLRLSIETLSEKVLILSLCYHYSIDTYDMYNA